MTRGKNMLGNLPQDSIRLFFVTQLCVCVLQLHRGTAFRQHADVTYIPRRLVAPKKPQRSTHTRVKFTQLLVTHTPSNQPVWNIFRYFQLPVGRTVGFLSHRDT